MRALKLLPLLTLLPISAVALPVKKIEILGLKWTKESLVRKELLIREGEEFNKKELELSIRNLLNTHLFYRVKAKVIKEKDGVIVKLYLKDKFPIVPMPRVRFKTSGAYKVGLELRDYNLFGLGHKLFAGYIRWFNEDYPSKRYYTYAELYRVIKGEGNLSLGAYYDEFTSDLTYDGKNLGKYKTERRSFPVSLHFYLDRRKVNQLTVGITPEFSNFSELLNDRKLYYFNFSYAKDLSTDMVYYTVGRKLSLGGSLSAPGISTVFTGNLWLNYFQSKKGRGINTRVFKAYFGTKVGYSGKGYYLESPIVGYSERKVQNKRFFAFSYSYRMPVVDRSIFVEPTLWVGDSFKDRPDDLLVSVGLEVNAFWARLADGIIRFKVYRGLTKGAKTNSSFRFTFRW
ncbi:POTRA domain-containing protein [Thermovibrio sp.]